MTAKISPTRKSRGRLLTALLLFAFLGWATTLPKTIHPDALQWFSREVSGWYALWVIGSTVLHLATYVGIWCWMRLAVYVFFLLGVIQLVLIGTIAKPLYAAAMPLFIAILVVWYAVWILAISRKWPMFG